MAEDTDELVDRCSPAQPQEDTEEVTMHLGDSQEQPEAVPESNNGEAWRRRTPLANNMNCNHQDSANVTFEHGEVLPEEVTSRDTTIIAFPSDSEFSNQEKQSHGDGRKDPITEKHGGSGQSEEYENINPTSQVSDIIYAEPLETLGETNQSQSSIARDLRQIINTLQSQTSQDGQQRNTQKIIEASLSILTNCQKKEYLTHCFQADSLRRDNEDMGADPCDKQVEDGMAFLLLEQALAEKTRALNETQEKLRELEGELRTLCRNSITEANESQKLSEDYEKGEKEGCNRSFEEKSSSVDEKRKEELTSLYNEEMEELKSKYEAELEEITNKLQLQRKVIEIELDSSRDEMGLEYEKKIRNFDKKLENLMETAHGKIVSLGEQPQESEKAHEMELEDPKTKLESKGSEREADHQLSSTKNMRGIEMESEVVVSTLLPTYKRELTLTSHTGRFLDSCKRDSKLSQRNDEMGDFKVVSGNLSAALETGVTWASDSERDDMETSQQEKDVQGKELLQNSGKVQIDVTVLDAAVGKKSNMIWSLIFPYSTEEQVIFESRISQEEATVDSHSITMVLVSPTHQINDTLTVCNMENITLEIQSSDAVQEPVVEKRAAMRCSQVNRFPTEEDVPVVPKALEKKAVVISKNVGEIALPSENQFNDTMAVSELHNAVVEVRKSRDAARELVVKKKAVVRWSEFSTVYTKKGVSIRSSVMGKKAAVGRVFVFIETHINIKTTECEVEKSLDAAQEPAVEKIVVMRWSKFTQAYTEEGVSVESRVLGKAVAVGSTLPGRVFVFREIQIYIEATFCELENTALIAQKSHESLNVGREPAVHRETIIRCSQVTNYCTKVYIGSSPPYLQEEAVVRSKSSKVLIVTTTAECDVENTALEVQEGAAEAGEQAFQKINHRQTATKGGLTDLQNKLPAVESQGPNHCVTTSEYPPDSGTTKRECEQGVPAQGGNHERTDREMVVDFDAEPERRDYGAEAKRVVGEVRDDFDATSDDQVEETENAPEEVLPNSHTVTSELNKKQRVVTHGPMKELGDHRGSSPNSVLSLIGTETTDAANTGLKAGFPERENIPDAETSFTKFSSHLLPLENRQTGAVKGERDETTTARGEDDETKNVMVEVNPEGVQEELIKIASTESSGNSDTAALRLNKESHEVAHETRKHPIKKWGSLLITSLAHSPTDGAETNDGKMRALGAGPKGKKHMNPAVDTHIQDKRVFNGPVTFVNQQTSAVTRCDSGEGISVRVSSDNNEHQRDETPDRKAQDGPTVAKKSTHNDRSTPKNEQEDITHGPPRLQSGKVKKNTTLHKGPKVQSSASSTNLSTTETLVTSATGRGDEWTRRACVGINNLRQLFACHIVTIILQLLIVCSFIPCGHADSLCQSPQQLQLGSTGVVNCAPLDFPIVSWFNSTITVQDHPLVTTNINDKSGRGYSSGEFDIAENGSLVIRNVSFQHEHEFCVVTLTDPDAALTTHCAEVVIVVLPEKRKPFITNVQDCSDNVCFARYFEDSIILCSVENARPAVNLSWAVRSGLTDRTVSPLSTRVPSLTVSGAFSSYTTLVDPFMYSKTLALTVCKANSHTNVLNQNESLLLLQNMASDLHSVAPVQLYGLVKSRIVLNCPKVEKNVFVWNRKSKNSQHMAMVAYSIFGKPPFVSLPGEKLYLNPDGSLVIPEVSVESRGTYICLAGDGEHEEARSYDVQVYAPAYPEVAGCGPGNYCVLLAEEHDRLTCIIQGVPKGVRLGFTPLSPQEASITFLEHVVEIRETGDFIDVSVSASYLASGSGVSAFQCGVLGEHRELFSHTAVFSLYVESAITTPTPKTYDVEPNGWKTALIVLVVALVVGSLIWIGVMLGTRCKGKEPSAKDSKDYEQCSQADSGPDTLTRQLSNSSYREDSQTDVYHETS